jgi:hypothetical protein
MVHTDTERMTGGCGAIQSTLYNIAIWSNTQIFREKRDTDRDREREKREIERERETKTKLTKI